MPAKRTAATEIRAIAALFAVFALVVQALLPTHVMAAPADGTGRITICTAMGTEVIGADGKVQPPNRGQHAAPCQDCLAAALVAVAAIPAFDAQPVAYHTVRVEHAAAADAPAPRARAPPRPPGQGPPTLLQTV